MAAKKLWHKYLPEVGRPIVSESDKLSSTLEKMDAASASFRALNHEFNEASAILESEVLKNWTKEEVEMAKKAAQEEDKYPS